MLMDFAHERSPVAWSQGSELLCYPQSEQAGSDTCSNELTFTWDQDTVGDKHIDGSGC